MMRHGDNFKWQPVVLFCFGGGGTSLAKTRERSAPERLPRFGVAPLDSFLRRWVQPTLATGLSNHPHLEKATHEDDGKFTNVTHAVFSNFNAWKSRVGPDWNVAFVPASMYALNFSRLLWSGELAEGKIGCLRKDELVPPAQFRISPSGALHCLSFNAPWISRDTIGNRHRPASNFQI
jgi:hypothetical protein